MSKKDTLGYKRNSPYNKAKSLLINSKSGNITMEDVPHPILGVGQNGETKLMLPENNYHFNSNKILELPIKQQGGMLSTLKKKALLKKHLSTLSESEQDAFIDQFSQLDPSAQSNHLMQLGGTPMQPNVEVEGGESAKIGQSLIKFEGPKHTAGGIKTNLPDGTQVFSEFLDADPLVVKEVLGKETDKKMSYSDLAKRFPTKKYEKLLADKKVDEYTANSAKIKLEHNNAMLDTIFQGQEASKVLGKQGFSSALKKMQDGGQTDFNLNAQFGMTGRNGRPFKQNSNYEDWSTASLNIREDPNLEDWDPNALSERFKRGAFGIDGNGGANTKPLPTSNKPVLGQNKTPRPKQVSTTTTNKTSTDYGRFVPKVEETDAPTFTDEFVQDDSMDARAKRTTPYTVGNDANQINTNVTTNTENSATTNTTSNKDKWFNNFGISSKLSGTIMDIGLAASDKLNVKNPTLYNNQKHPIFSRFFQYDDKESQKNFQLAIQQIQNSNMPEGVKQARIAEIAGQAAENQGKVDFTNAQRYDAKQEGDVNKLQQYIDNNNSQRNQDLESYNQRKAQVDYLKDQFMAQRKGRIVNSARNYLDYIDTTNKENQLAENYTLNPITGKINFKEKAKDPLKNKEDLMRQYAQNSANNKMDLGNGVTMTMVGPGIGIVVGEDKKPVVVNLNNK